MFDFYEGGALQIGLLFGGTALLGLSTSRSTSPGSSADKRLNPTFAGSRRRTSSLGAARHDRARRTIAPLLPVSSGRTGSNEDIRKEDGY
jgi:hypothetical protein